jgi:hypothetical protein
MKFECVVPILNVRDFAVSMEYYIEKMGFAKKWDWGTPPTFGCVKRDEVDIFLCEGGQGHPGMWMSIFMEDVDALHEEYKTSGASIRMPPTNMPWGTRETNEGDLLWSGASQKKNRVAGGSDPGGVYCLRGAWGKVVS